ncbi:nucleotide pyrophosphatase/phosphodiesterase-like protein [Tanacetum coccineum]
MSSSCFKTERCRYSKDYRMFHFCIADLEHDWREGSEQYAWIEKCLTLVDRQKQPWLIFSAHRVLGYSSNSGLTSEGAFEELNGTGTLAKTMKKVQVDIAFTGMSVTMRGLVLYIRWCVGMMHDD